MGKHGRRYQQAKSEIDTERVYHPLHAVRMVKAQELTRFDPTVEVHVRLGVNVRHADQQLRGTISLPHGTGSEVTVAVFAEGDKAREAEAAGADFVGGDDLAKRIQDGFTDFDVAIATPDMMGTVGKLGRILGPSGKMPNPKSGTVTFDIAKAVTDVKGGKVEYRTDRTGIVHIGIGKRSFEERQLIENYQAVIEEIVRGQAGGRQGALSAVDHHGPDDGPGHPDRHHPHLGRRRRGGARRAVARTRDRRHTGAARPPQTARDPRAPVRGRREAEGPSGHPAPARPRGRETPEVTH